MVSIIADRTYVFDRFMKDEVVVMEDSLPMKHAIQQVIGSIGWQTRFVNSRREAVEVVQNKEAAYFILDNWIDANKQEGFDTLEVIRELDEQVFVTILTGHPDPINEKLAKRLNANLYKEKSADNYRKDIEEIASAMLEYKKQIFSNLISIINDQLDKLDKEHDVNLIAYERAKQNSEWLKQYTNQYVAFIDGEFFDSSPNKFELLKLIRAKYPDKHRFFTKVDEIEEKPIDLSMASWLDDIDI
ncbi:MAG: response regulator [Crocosphaera sp.]